MNKTRFKVGDVVRLKKGLKPGRYKGMNFLKEMIFSGSRKIKGISDWGNYLFDDDGRRYAGSWLELVDQEAKHPIEEMKAKMSPIKKKMLQNALDKEVKKLAPYIKGAPVGLSEKTKKRLKKELDNKRLPEGSGIAPESIVSELEVKCCKKCNKNKPVSEFPLKGYGYRRMVCKKCWNITRKEKRAEKKNPMVTSDIKSGNPINPDIVKKVKESPFKLASNKKILFGDGSNIEFQVRVKSEEDARKIEAMFQKTNKIIETNALLTEKADKQGTLILLQEEMKKTQDELIEKQHKLIKKSVFPVVMFYISVVGGLVILAYNIWKPIFILLFGN